MKLNPSQQQAVEYNDGPLLILAGAGSGKTRVITEKIAYILENRLARSNEIMAVTFTNKAAAELKDRIVKRIRENHSQSDRNFTTQYFPWVGTFHSLCVKLLKIEYREAGLSPNFSIYDGDDQLSVVKSVMRQLKIDEKRYNPRAVLGGISAAKNELIPPNRYDDFATGFFESAVSQVYVEYQKTLEANEALDFDDLIMKSVKLLQQNEQILAKYQELFKFILVDEYQDTNHAQYMLVKLFAQARQKIFVVGDDDQSIYAWRGATVRNILEFEHDFDNVKVVKLEQNYRSTQKILNAGNSIAAGIAKRKAKSLWTENPDGDNIRIYSAMDEKDEAMWVVNEIAKQMPAVDLDEVAILYRMNAQSRILEEMLLKVGIPYRIVGNVRFYERREIKDTLAYLRILYNKSDDVSLLRIINVPSRKIGAKTIASLKTAAQEARLTLLEFLWQQGESFSGGVGKFARILKNIDKFAQEHNVSELIKFVQEESGYLKSLEVDNEENRQRLTNLQELINVAAKYSELSPQASLQAFLEEVSLQEASTLATDSSGKILNGDANRGETSGQSASKNGDKGQLDSARGGSDKGADIPGDGRVTLMTVHSAKGLEFGEVFIVGMDEGIFPHSRSLYTPSELDEERRLAYVAVTRAKSRLSLCYAQSRTTFGTKSYSSPSRFLEDLNKDEVSLESYGSIWQDSDDGYWHDASGRNDEQSEFSSARLEKGLKVRHEKFGTGFVQEVDESYVKVDFLDYGIKELAVEYANLTTA